jgi:uncharacterized phage protein (TIGR01671 family)
MTPNRFRFRAWDRKNKRMITPSEAKDYQSIIAMCQFGNQVGFINADGSTFWSPYCTLMQSTGLADKNGREMFEGDVLELDQCWNDDDSERIRHALTWDMVVSGWLKDMTSPTKYRAFYVVGNVYENPGLIK